MFTNVGTMGNKKLIVSVEYRNAHGCKVVTGDDSNFLIDEIYERIDMSVEGDNLQDGQNYGQESHKLTTSANGKMNQFDMIVYYYIIYLNM